MKKTAMAALAWILAMGVLGATASARTDTFAETATNDFDAGHAEGVVVSSLGTLRLGRAVEDLLKEADGVDYVARMAQAPDGTVYVVTGGAGHVYRVGKDGKVDLYVTLDDPFLFSCAVDADGVLYVGSGGTKGRVWRVEPQKDGGPKPTVFFEADGVKYVWDLVCLKDGTLAAATGDQGQVLHLTRDGKSEVLIDSEASHVLCLALAPDGTLYAGTDGDALVYRYADKKTFILYDADEAEVTGLTLDADGNLYVGTSSGAGGRQTSATGETARMIVTDVTIELGDDDDESTAAKADKASKAEGASGGDEAAEGADDQVTPPETPPAPPSVPTTPGTPPTTGSGVYRITPAGLVTRVFSGREAMVLGLAVSEGRLLVATGNAACVYEVALDDGREQSCVATVDPKQATALFVADGRVLVGTASPGRLYGLSKGYAKEGVYTSRVYDAAVSATWGSLEWRGRTPGGTEIRLATRSGNVGDPEKGGWSDWSFDATGSPSRIQSPAARFIQFRVTMKSGDAAVTPVLEQFEAAYVPVNEPPEVVRIEEVTQGDESARAKANAEEQFRQEVTDAGRDAFHKNEMPKPPRGLGRQTVRTLQWVAGDPNHDDLRFDLYVRGQGEAVWVLLAEGLVRNEYPWDTSTVADGWYEIKVVASDRADNAADRALEGFKITDPILVDNTAPEIQPIETQVTDGAVEVKFTAADATSRLVGAAYTVDSSLDWKTLEPTDGIFDAQKKEFHFTIPGLTPGAHRVAVRVSDLAANSGYSAQVVTMPEEKK